MAPAAGTSGSSDVAPDTPDLLTGSQTSIVDIGVDGRDLSLTSHVPVSRGHPLVRGSTRSGRMAAMGTYYFNTRTGLVEDLEGKSPSRDLLGPYTTREEAERALTTAHERTEKWDEEDRAWNEGRPGSETGGPTDG
jgi:hypothetical protein